MQQRTNPFQSWLALTKALEMEFGPSPYECPRSTLFKLQQTHSMNEYYMAFTTLANRVYGISVEAFLDCFIGRLQ